MKSLFEVGKSLGLDLKESTEFIRFIQEETDIEVNPSMMYGKQINDSDVKRAKFLYIQKKSKQRAHDKAIADILVSSGFNFDGFKIVKYSGYISGDDTIQIDRDTLCKYDSQKICDALVKIRVQALKELKEAAFALGCNAVIGVDFDYMTFEPQTANLGGGTTYYPYVICVTANGNAVVIEKEYDGIE